MFCSVEYGPTIFNYWHEGELVANFTFKLMGKSWTSIFVSYIYMLACPQTSSLTMQGIVLPATHLMQKFIFKY